MSITAVRCPLSLADREEISRGLAQGVKQKGIAARLGRCPSVVSRDILRHGGRDAYRAAYGNARAAQARTRPKERKLDRLPQLPAG